MSDRSASDITPGSLWPGKAGGYARIVSVGCGYVRFVGAGGSVQIMHHARFRESFYKPFDARQLRSQFSMSVANLASFHVFYSKQTGRMYARSCNIDPRDCREASRGRPALPPDAVHVGTYADDVIVRTRWKRKGLTSFDKFLQDLNDVLAESTCAA